MADYRILEKAGKVFVIEKGEWRSCRWTTYYWKGEVAVLKSLKEARKVKYAFELEQGIERE